MPPDSLSTRAAFSLEGESALLAALRRGDEAAFLHLVERFQPCLLRLASIYVSNPRVAEEVVQETWLGVLRGLDRFEARSSLKTWIFRILVNTAKTRAVREGRTIPFSALEDPATDRDGPSVPADRFLPPDHARWPHHWASPPQPWNTSPEEMLLSAETRAHIERAIQALRPSQREVITLRDIQGLTSTEVCNVLGVSETNQRVLLHRARSKVRNVLERYLTEEPGG